MSQFESTLEQLTRLRSTSDLAFDRTGASLYATVTPATRERERSYESRIWRFALDGAAEQTTQGPSADGLPRPDPNGDRLAFASDRRSPGKMAPYLLEGSSVVQLPEPPGTIEDMEWLPNGSALVVLAADDGLDAAAIDGAVRLSWAGSGDDPEVTSPVQARRRLFRIGLDGKQPVEIGPPDLSVWEFSLIGAHSALAVVSGDPSERGWYHTHIERIDFTDRSTEKLYQGDWQLQGPTASPDGAHVAFLEGWSSDRGLVAGEIRILVSSSGTVTRLAAEKLSDVSSVHWRDNESLWFAAWSELGTAYGIVTLGGDVEWIESERAVIGPNSFFAEIVPAPDGKGIAAIREAVGEPPEIVHRGGPNAPWKTITKLNEGIAGAIPGYPDVREIKWAGAGGLAMQGLLLLPPDRNTGPSPMIVDVHGGPTWSSKYAFNPGFALPLSAAGYVVFLVNYRGNVGWGQDFAKLNIGDPGGAEFEDILLGIDKCIADGIADPDRLGVTGASYGGYMTAWAVATTNRFKAAVMVSGISDQFSCHYSCNHDFSEFIVGGPLTDDARRNLAIDRSPLARLDTPTTPTLVLHGREDRCTPLGQAQEFYSALIERGVPAELVAYPREGHGFQEKAHDIDASRRTKAWFDRYLRSDA